MGIRRACSYQVSFQTPQPPAGYSDILVSFGQNGNVLFNKTEDELVIGETSVIAQLTQEETRQFKAGVAAQIQIRCFASTYNAPGSKEFFVDVWPALNDVILGGE